jgi:hypothetical protein
LGRTQAQVCDPPKKSRNERQVEYSSFGSKVQEIFHSAGVDLDLTEFSGKII